jgi:hypothetical protein
MDPKLIESGQLLVRRPGDVVVQIEPRLVSVDVAGEIYGVSADTIVRLQDDEDFPIVRIGKRRLVPIAAADAWFARLGGDAA